MRASRQTELLDQFPIKDVCGWIGNTEAIAMEAYAMQRDSSFQQAIALEERDSESDSVGPKSASESDAVDHSKPEQSEAEEAENAGDLDISQENIEVFSGRGGTRTPDIHGVNVAL